MVPGVRLRGLEILGVVPGSPAGRVGLEAGDVILSVGLAGVVTPDDLRRALSGPDSRLRLKVFDLGTDQVLNVNVDLGPTNPGPFPPPVTVMGRVKVDVLTVGGETTGITLTAADGKVYDLAFAAGHPPGREADGRFAVASGWLRAVPGPERPGRRVIRVEQFRLVGRAGSPGGVGGVGPVLMWASEGDPQRAAWAFASGLNPGAARIVRIGLPSARFQRRTSPSQLPEAMVLPSGERAML